MCRSTSIMTQRVLINPTARQEGGANPDHRVAMLNDMNLESKSVVLSDKPVSKVYT